MTDNIIDKLEKMADSYKNGELDITYEEYETICQAWSEIEILRKDVNRLHREMDMELFGESDYDDD